MTRAKSPDELEWTRSRFVDAALTVFGEKGFFGATMEEISIAAGYSGSAIYKYFKHKDEVFEHAQNRIATEMHALWDEPIPVSLPFRDRLAWRLDRVYAKLNEFMPFIATFLSRWSYPEIKIYHEGSEHIRATHQRAFGKLVELMQEGIDEGVLRPGRPEDYAAALMGIDSTFFFRRLSTRSELSVEQDRETILTIFLNGVMRRAGEE